MATSRRLLRRIGALALPNILSNVTVPLLMLADTAMAGRMERAESIAAVAIGAAITQFVIGVWSLLRMGTTGFTAQAWGACDAKALLRQLASGSIIALVIGLLLVFLRPLYIAPAAALLQGSASLQLPEAETYLHYSFLGAPAALLLYVLNGWLIGVQRMKLVMSVSILCNLLNIFFSFLLAFPADLGVGGLALGTALAQYCAVGLLLLGAVRSQGRILMHFRRDLLWHPPTLLRYFHVGKYLLIRTLLLQAVTLSFIRYGGLIGVTTLAANSLLMQLFTLFSYFMDGLAYAAEALVGEAIGARAYRRLGDTVSLVLRTGAVTALTVSLLYLAIPHPFLTLLTDKEEVLRRALDYSYWMGAVPLVSFGAFLWDGILVGATDSRTMGLAMIFAALTFFLVAQLTLVPFGVHGLWLAFLSYLLVRSLLEHHWGTRRLRRYRREA
ncbi:MAG: MATE family efflux transporter, partial [Porphyromonas sp.]